jgi:sortase A
MRDKRPVDELSIEELERILVIRKREARMDRVRHMEGSGRVVAPSAPIVRAAEEANKAAITESALLDEAEAETPEAESESIPEKSLPKTYFEDEPTFEDELDRRSRQRSTRRTSRKPADPNAKSPLAIWWNRLLVLVEIGAAFGLIYLVANLFQVVQSATQTSAQIQSEYQATAAARLIPPTSTPVININAVVLPVGHTVNVNAQGIVSAVFNLDEVPAEYRDEYRTLLTKPYIPPTPSPEGPVRVQIPKIKVDSKVVAGTDWESLKLGVGQYLNGINPGQRGNIVLAAHNDVYNEIFRDLDQLKPGDMITVSTMAHEYTYVVQGTQIVKPTDVWVMDSRGDTKQLTLISCYPYRVDTKRIVVFATLQAG